MVMHILPFILLAACTDAGSDTGQGDELTFPWAPALSKYAGCSMDLEMWATEGGGYFHGADMHYEYDDNGAMVLEEYYDVAYADGDLSYQLIRETDELGRFLSWTQVNGASGDVDYLATFTWSGAEATGYMLESPSGAFVDMQYTITNDEHGRWVSEAGDEYPFDGIAEEDVYTYEYGDGVLGRGGFDDYWQFEKVTETRYGEPFLVYQATYDDNGLRLTVDREAFGSYAFHQVGEYTYDEHGREESAYFVCDAPCWKWDETEILFEWDCPE